MKSQHVTLMYGLHLHQKIPMFGLHLQVLPHLDKIQIKEFVQYVDQERSLLLPIVVAVTEQLVVMLKVL